MIRLAESHDDLEAALRVVLPAVLERLEELAVHEHDPETRRHAVAGVRGLLASDDPRRREAWRRVVDRILARLGDRR